jgi:glycosyltransferase involved in cell wall biosynthesis
MIATEPPMPASEDAIAPSRPLRALFLGVTYAGHRTRFQNLRRHTERDRRLLSDYREVDGWKPGGLVERIGMLPASARGRARAVAQSAAFARLPRPDVIWSSVVEVLTPHLWSQVGPLRRPVVLDLDWTFDQGEAFAPVYFGRPPRTGLRRAVGRWQEHALWGGVAMFLPWSRWAAESLRAQGIPDGRIRVLPPGVDLGVWRPRPELRGGGDNDGRVRVLFVGGDFARKGGPMLLDVFRERFADTCALDIVTRDAVAPAPNVRVHAAEANSPLLRELYARADLFVLPTRAEAFGIATTEALASGLPAIASDIGGARDIIDPGETGWLIDPTPASLAAALAEAVADRARLRAMGERARRAAEERFDGARNDRIVADIMVEVGERARRQRERGHR